MSRRSVVKPNEYILMWAGDAPKTVTSHGQAIVVPPHDQIADGKGIYRFGAARDDAGRPVPGTVLLRDKIGSTPDGGQVLEFDARAWVEMLEANNTLLFESGFEVVETIERVVELMPGCRERYELSRAASAESVIRAELTRQERYKAQGQPAPPSPNGAEVVWAMELLRSRRERARADAVPVPSQADMLAALGDNALPSPSPAASVTPEAPRRGPGRPRKVVDPQPEG